MTDRACQPHKEAIRDNSLPGSSMRVSKMRARSHRQRTPTTNRRTVGGVEWWMLRPHGYHDGIVRVARVEEKDGGTTWWGSWAVKICEWRSYQLKPNRTAWTGKSLLVTSYASVISIISSPFGNSSALTS